MLLAVSEPVNTELCAVLCWRLGSGHGKPGPTSQAHCPEGGVRDSQPAASRTIADDTRVWKETSQGLG